MDTLEEIDLQHNNSIHLLMETMIFFYKYHARMIHLYNKFFNSVIYFCKINYLGTVKPVYSTHDLG